ncbi:hypothetical protein IMCC21224_111166 [Puniceibacterium sp. IMCC21224]|nr:hypothetical protein IMCC21224_111166 [Puniceibacterium sp. IMCC21224]
MTRAFLVVMDSVGIGGAPDAATFFNGDLPDTGANTLAHIAQTCAAGQAKDGRSGSLRLPVLERLGLGAAVRLASDEALPGYDATPTGLWGRRPNCRAVRIRPRVTGNLRGCRCPGTGIISPTLYPPFRLKLCNWSVIWPGPMASLAIAMGRAR